MSYYESEFDDYEWEVEHGFIDGSNSGVEEIEEDERNTKKITAIASVRSRRDI